MLESPPKQYGGSMLATALGGYALLGGLISFLGWPLDVRRLTDWLNNGVSIQPNTCVLLMLSGAAVVLLQGRTWRAVAVLGALVGLGGALILLQYIVGVDFGFNHQLLFGRTWGQLTTLTPGRMGPPASTSFTLAGIALVLLGLAALKPRWDQLRRLVPMFGMAVCVAMAFSLFGYLFGAEQFYTIPWLTAIALPAATMLLAVGLGLILSVPERQPMLLLRERSGAGALARIALPALVVMIPLVLWLYVRGFEERLYDRGSAIALGALTFIVGAFAVLWIALMSLRRREQALRDSEARHRTLVQVAVHGVITIDERGIIESVNPAAERLFDYRRDELVGQNVALLMPAPYKGEHDGYLKNYLETGVRKIIGIGREVVGRRKDGSTFPMDLAVSEFHLGQKRYFTGIVVDITQQVQARQQIEESRDALQEADRRKDEFLATLAHELRNPLAPVMSSLALMEQLGGQDDVGVEARAIMGRQLKQLVRLVDDLLDVSRITRGKIVLRKERIELSGVVEQAVESVRPMCQVEAHEVLVELPPGAAFLDADPVRIAQVLGNLLSNACRYSNRGAPITLRAEREGSDIVVSVIDQGFGIEPAKLDSIFGMFSQLDRSGEPAGGGLGIGLYLVKRLVELHDGTITAHSAGPGHGSRFVVRLPLVIEPARDALPGPATGPEERLPEVTRRRILVVDDNQDAAHSMAVLLQADGHVTQTAYDGQQALEAAQRFTPDLVLLDIGLPNKNGYEVCRQIREQPWGRQMMLVAVTGWGQEEDKRRARESGFDAHLIKPVQLGQLRELVASLPPSTSQRHEAVTSGK